MYIYIYVYLMLIHETLPKKKQVAHGTTEIKMKRQSFPDTHWYKLNLLTAQ